MKRLLLILAFVGNLGWVQAEDLCVVSYNVENLFHPKHDSIVTSEGVIEKDDWEWMPDGERRWSYARYYRKVENIARVLTNIGEWKGVDVVGLQEVENALCVKRLCYTLRRGEYDFVHYESPDRRGIDVALIYKKNRLDTIATRAIPVRGLEIRGLEDELITRDILYVCAKVKGEKKEQADTIHFFVCHLPSQRGGKAESEWKRVAAKRVLEEAVDSVYGIDPKAKIVVMGDMNSEPKEDLAGLRNKMIQDGQSPTGRGKTAIGRQAYRNGTHKYQGKWTCLDQFYTSPALDSISEVKIYDAEWIQETDEKYLGLKPKRTYIGFKYQNGYSDHLPIQLILNIR